MPVESDERRDGPPPGIRLRQLTAADFMALCRYNWAPLLSERDTIYLFVTQDHARYCFAAEDEKGNAVGYVVAAGSADGGSVFVFHVHVGYRHRRRGVGAALVRALEDAARDNGARMVWLLARDKARDFYLRLGYQEMDGILDPAAAGYVKHAKRTRVMGKRLDG